MDSLARRWAPLSPVSSHTTVGEKPDEYWWETFPLGCTWRGQSHQRLEGTSGRMAAVKLPRRESRMKRLTLLLLGLALGVSATAGAQGLTMQMSNGWSFSFSGNVNAFWVYTKINNSGPANSSIRTGLLPTFATFEAKGKEAGMNLGIHFGFAPQIQNAGVHDNFGNGTQAGAQIDIRQVYLTVGFADGGSLLVGRELGLFQRQNILTDMTLFGVGAVGNPQGGGTTLGRIGYGYIYPNFNAQVTYTTSPKNPAQLSIGLFQPSVLGTTASLYSVTKLPRLEAEATYHQTSGTNKFMVWVGGEWQSTSSRDAGDSTKSTIGGTAGVKADIQDLSIVVSGYTGSGLGHILGFTGAAVAGNGTLRKSDGAIVQVTYAVDKKSTVGASWGTSRLKGSGTGETSGPIGVVSLYTVGVYHQWTKSLKLVFEGSREVNSLVGTNETVLGNPLNRTDISAGFMLFY